MSKNPLNQIGFGSYGTIAHGGEQYTPMGVNSAVSDSRNVRYDRGEMQKASSDYWAGRKTDGHRGGSRMSRELRRGYEGFSIDPARLEAYLRRKAACIGISQQVNDDRRKADSAYEAKRSQAQRYTSERKRVPEELAVEVALLKAEFDAATKRYDEAGEESNSILEIVGRIEKYVDQHKAARRDRIERSRWQSIEGNGQAEGQAS